MRLTYLKNGDTLTLDPGLCRGCRQCIEVCPHAVFLMVDGTSTIADRASCMECGACMRNCASGAVRVTAGVGCAAAVIGGMLRGTAASCGPECGEGAVPGATKGTCCSKGA